MEMVPEFLTERILGHLVYPDMEQVWYWSSLWDGQFYIDLARAGFITICTDHPEAGCILLPQLHSECAVLDWGDRHQSKSLSSFIRGGALERMGARLKISRNIDTALDCLSDAWQDHSWLYPPYRELMRSLSFSPDDANFPITKINRHFTPIAVELWAEGCDRPIAGELGYIIGGIYTSLTGFMHPDRQRWKNLGKVQLHALALLLEGTGFAFWHLGQSQMQYKIDLGARVTSRPEFLERWLSKRDADFSPQFDSLLEKEIPCQELFDRGLEYVLSLNS